LHNPISLTGLLAKTTKADTTRAKSTQAQNGMEEKSKEFAEKGNEVFAKA